MAWIGIDDKGNEIISDAELVKVNDGTLWVKRGYYNLIVLPKGSIKKLIGRKLTWEDDPIELKEDCV